MMLICPMGHSLLTGRYKELFPCCHGLLLQLPVLQLSYSRGSAKQMGSLL